MKSKLGVIVLVAFSFVVFASYNASAGAYNEVESNNTRLDAQDISNGFTNYVPSNIANWSGHPYKHSVSVYGTGDTTIDYYKFTLLEESSVIFDIDYGYSQSGLPDSVDTYLAIYNDVTADSFISTYGGGYTDPGSVDGPIAGRTPDPWISPRGKLQPGTYYAGVFETVIRGNTGYNEGLHPGSTYVLHVASTHPVAITPEPVSSILFLLGGGVIAFRRKFSR